MKARAYNLIEGRDILGQYDTKAEATAARRERIAADKADGLPAPTLLIEAVR